MGVVGVVGAVVLGGGGDGYVVRCLVFDVRCWAFGVLRAVRVVLIEIEERREGEMSDSARTLVHLSVRWCFGLLLSLLGRWSFEFPCGIFV